MLVLNKSEHGICYDKVSKIVDKKYWMDQAGNVIQSVTG